MTNTGRPLLDTLVINYVSVLKFRVCEHGMPCYLEINSNGGFKQGNVESCPLTLANNAYGLQTLQSGDLR